MYRPDGNPEKAGKELVWEYDGSRNEGDRKGGEICRPVNMGGDICLPIMPAGTNRPDVPNISGTSRGAP